MNGSSGSDPLTPRLARIRGRRRDGADVWTLDLRDESGSDPHFQPGQFNMLTVFGVGEIPVSVSGDPGRTGRLVHTVRAVGAVSRALAALRCGDVVGLRGPFGSAWPIAEAAGRDVVVVAGGLGLAPLRPALYRLAALRRQLGRFTLLYGARSPADLLFRRELERCAERADLDVQVTVDHATADWRGRVGFVTTLITRLAPDPGRTLALICGPELMMRRSAAALLELGVPPESVYVSLERNMKCAVALCGRCQLGPVLVCRDGAVFRYDHVRALLARREF